MSFPSARFTAALATFDAANAEDPNQETDAEGQSWPKELLYGHRMSACLARVAPEAPEPVQLAARCQHIRRWAIPRADFPLDRPGYHQWRNTLKKYHAEVAGQLLTEVGYDEATIGRVQALLQKQQLTRDADMQLLEDVICLVFLEHYFLDFARQHPEEKIIVIVQKTWRKMTPQGHALALQLPLPAEAQALVAKALA
ncbi:DUF4202 domain-containing protein [Hymenobacter chitinivorans]|uniref:Uncharacterized protein DUF4202 n=1 Tax=Hymenobacter chitinivorans DSM 11115 TaxID=1121954 RepID=A0A2M9BRW9_9BACT|nr:DUF4202 domain-containing protein [Hymenobacter chitinivorans]PJJ60695.1 uncharacterized protein DUF4202 [Hymenobacter chitinivorans DSM 11115]